MTLVISKGITLAKTFYGLVADLDSRDYLARVHAAEGQTLEPEVCLAVEAFIVGCKADGIWDAIKASCILAGARTLTGALVPLVGSVPSNNNFVAGDYDRKTGLVGDGTTKFLNSNRNHGTDPQNNRHISCWASQLATGSFDIYIGFGSGATNGATHIGRNSSSATSQTDQLYIRCGSTTVATPSDSHVVGLLGASRSSSSEFVGRFNASSSTFSAASQTPDSGGNYGIFHNFTQSLQSNARIAFYSIGESLDLALLDARVSALITAIGAAF
jgi:hypothetical protein